jgi:hypothetical protein
MHKTLFLHEVKPPTSKTFNFFLSKGIILFSLHPLFPDFLLQIIILFKLRYAFVLPPLFLRFKAVLSPFLRMGEKWDLHGSHKGLTWDLERSHKDLDEFISLRGIKPTM